MQLGAAGAVYPLPNPNCLQRSVDVKLPAWGGSAFGAYRAIMVLQIRDISGILLVTRYSELAHIENLADVLAIIPEFVSHSIRTQFAPQVTYKRKVSNKLIMYRRQDVRAK